jgi:hypothetical protein
MSELNEVDHRLSIHEAVCAERYNQIISRMQSVERVLYAAATAMIGALAYIAWGVAAAR